MSIKQSKLNLLDRTLPMWFDEYGTAYDVRNDRDIKIIRDPAQLKYNVLDEDLLYKLWNLKEQSKK